MSLFGNIYSKAKEAAQVGSGFAIDDEFIEMAVELIDDFLEDTNSIWVSVNPSSLNDQDKPFEINKPNEQQCPVKIVYLTDDLEDRQYRKFRKETTMVDGQINGIMYAYPDFEPKLNDVVIWKGKTLTVNAIDPIQPFEKVLLYTFEFGS